VSKKMIDVSGTFLGKAEVIEEVICLSALIAGRILPMGSTIEDASDFYEKTQCFNCPIEQYCLACFINL